MTRSEQITPTVWAMRSLRSRRSAALRVEPSFTVSKLRSAATIATFWLLVFGLAVVA